MSKSIKNISEFKLPESYTLLKSEYIEETEGFGILLRHKKSGARVMLLSSEDDNKVFSIGFKTPPTDDTGTQHIIEHTVLCGSKEFPAKDPFVELVKGSLNTYLNATTYPDKTLYPVASTNEKDFKNLMHVYMDAVFFPNIYDREEIFKQEGWHYELESADAPLTINGVVYNEMKGAYSSDDNMLETYMLKALFPDTVYSNDSGGAPEVIPTLTRENYLEYHKNFYHPVNSYIYLYGDIDLEERLIWMDENYLSKFDEIELDASIENQKKFESIHKEVREYAVLEGDDSTNNTMYAYATLTDVTQDRNICKAMDILSYVLFDMPGAYLKEALINKGLGTDVTSDVCDLLQQSYIAIMLKNVEIDKSDEILDTIHETCKELCEKGIDKDVLYAAINAQEFRDREADFGSAPKGLLYYLRAMHTWLYDDSKAFEALRYEEAYKYIKDGVENGLFEKLIKEYFLDNTHQVIVEMRGKSGLTAEKDKETADKLAEYKASLSTEEIQKIVDDTAALKKYQSEPTPAEDLEKIPLLKISDIDKNARPINYEERKIGDLKTIFIEENTNGITYSHIYFNVNDLKNRIPELSLFTSLLGYMNTKDHSYLEFDTVVNMHLGDLSSLIMSGEIYDTTDTNLLINIGFKALKGKLKEALPIVKEMLYRTVFNDEKRLLDVIRECRSRFKNAMLYSGHASAALRARAQISMAAAESDAIAGVEYYNYLVDLDENFESRKQALISDLEMISEIVFTEERATVMIGTDEEGYREFEENVSLLDLLKKDKREAANLSSENTCVLELLHKNEAFTTPAKVQYVAIAGDGKNANYNKNGVMNVIRHLLNYDYLWNNVRVLGGAYGVSCRFTRNKIGFFTSYRDPKLMETVETYKKAHEFLKNYDVDDRELTKTIIGTISGMDIPLTPYMKFTRSEVFYLSKMPFEVLQNERNEVLNCTKEDIREAAGYIAEVTKDPVICVIGSEDEIKKVQEEDKIFVDIFDIK
ncbi:MAG: insulinase family protein [Lachnospiraceae bacterium]|nr:insulinase family protein [Lachnospiraceae bacterium]